jgi:hypothetical protein
MTNDRWSEVCDPFGMRLSSDHRRTVDVNVWQYI